MSNKDVAWSFFEHLTNGRIDEASFLLADEGTWWLSSRRRAVPMTNIKPAARKIFKIVPMKFTLHFAIEEGDQVALDVESRATLADGSVYNNVYCYLLTISAARFSMCVSTPTRSMQPRHCRPAPGPPRRPRGSE